MSSASVCPFQVPSSSSSSCAAPLGGNSELAQETSSWLALF